jgi:hypothetical protein
MLSIEIRVNGSPITVIDARNVATLPNGKCTYEFRAMTLPLEMADAPETKTGTVYHYRSDGINELAIELLKTAIL